MNVTKRILAMAPELEVSPEVTPGRENFSMFNTGSTEVEVSEFLYALVRMVKPQAILETGTHLGVSSTYMALAMQDNGGPGVVTTLEVMPSLVKKAKQLWGHVGVADRLQCLLQPSLKFDPGLGQYDIVFLDSEPHLRFDEFLRFWPVVRPSGVILIHDLHPHLGHTGSVVNDMYDWPYGDFRPKLGPFIMSHQVQVLSFPTPRGLTMFQKMSEAHGAYNLLTGEW